MSGKEILVDTNIVLYLLEGSDTLANFLQGKAVFLSFISELELLGYKDVSLLQGKAVFLSFISELELLGYKDVSLLHEKQIVELLGDCTVLSLTESIKERYIKLRRSHKIKLADAIIAATSIVSNIPLITADADFKKISELDLITYTHGIDLI